MMTCEQATASYLPGLAETASDRREIFYTKADSPLPDEVLRQLAKDDYHKPAPSVCDLAPALNELMGARLVDVSPLGAHGTFHSLYRVGFSDGRRCVLRVNRLSRLYRDFLLYVDEWAAGVLITHGLPAAAVYAVDLSRRLFPADFAVMAEAAGTSLRRMDDADALTAEILGQMGEFFASLHEIDAEGFGLVDLRRIATAKNPPNFAPGTFDSWWQYLTLRLEEHVQFCRDIDAVTSAEATKILRRFDQAEPALAGVQPAMLHGDPGSHNIFFDGRGISAVLDWEDCLTGDPVFEIAHWGTFHPGHRLGAFLAGYRRRRELPANFQWRYWLYYLRVSLAKTVHRRRFNYQDRPNRPPAAGRIQEGLEKLDELAET